MDNKSIFEDISLTFNQSDLIVLTGESGAGKSSFLKLLNRFCSIISGELYYAGRNLTDYRIEELRSSIIYLPQIPYVIEGSIMDNLIFPYSFKVNAKKQFNTTRALELIEYFNLDTHFQDDARQLSIGQMQRLSLIRSILLEPEVLLLDEPGSSLDERNRQTLERKVESLTDISDITVIMATHGDVCFKKKHRLFNIRDKKIIESHTS